MNKRISSKLDMQLEGLLKLQITHYHKPQNNQFIQGPNSLINTIQYNPQYKYTHTYE